MKTLLLVFVSLLVVIGLLLIPLIKTWLSERINNAKKAVQDQDLWKTYKDKLISLLIIIGCVVVFNVIAANADWVWWSLVWKHGGHLFLFIWSGIVYATFAWFNAHKPAVKIFAGAVFICALSAIYTVGFGGYESKVIQPIVQSLWVGETVVGNQEVILKSPHNRAPFRFHVKNSEGTRMSIRLHGGDACYILSSGERVKEIMFKDGVPEQSLRNANWEGAVEWIGARSLVEGQILTVVSNEIGFEDVIAP